MSNPRAQLECCLAPGFRIERELGRGGMATVFRAYDLRHGRSVAVKVLHPELSAEVGWARFRREIEIAYGLQHPHIIPIYDSGHAGDLLYYIMGYASGGSLRDRLKREKQLSLADVLEIQHQLSSALSYAHGRGVLHRDIKPENILLQDDQAMLADFGIARVIGETVAERITTAGLAVGTPAYMSPEQATGERDLDERSDLYSLACVVYEMLAGEPPFTGPTPQAIMARRIAGDVPKLGVIREGVPKAVASTLERALAKVPADRFATVSQFSAALSAAAQDHALVDAAPPPSTARRRIEPSRKMALGMLAVLGLLGLSALGAKLLAPNSPIALNPDLVAIAPFEVIGRDLDLWREGAMDLLANDLNGAGPLKVLTPAAALRHWNRLAGEGAAEQLGRRTGAGMSITGSIVTSGADSVLISASVLDVRAGESLGEVRVVGSISRIDLAMDSLTVALLRTIGRVRPIGAVQLASIHTSSLLALKAYLEGEQHFRRAAWDSAERHFEEAAELDPSFALAYHRIFECRGFSTPGLDSLAWSFALRAGSLNRGLAVRESLLVAADSVLASLMVGQEEDTSASRVVGRALSTLRLAARRFPNDPESWYQLGFATNRFGWLVGLGSEDALEPLDRAINLDSAFAPAYVEALQGAIVARGPAAAGRYLSAYLRLKPTGPAADVARLAQLLLDGSHPAEADRILDTASSVVIYQTLSVLEWWPDSAETAVRLARRLDARPADPNLSPDPRFARRVLCYALAWRGHVGAAYRVWDGKWLAILTQLALLGGAPRDTTAAVFAALLRAQPWPDPALVFGLPWWGQTRDTVSLKEVAARVAALPPSRRSNADVRYLDEAARAYLALSLADTTLALRLFLALSHPVNYEGVGDWERYTAVRLLNVAGQPSEALQRLDQEVRSTAVPLDVLLTVERARALRALGARDSANAAYREISQTWAHADPGLQPWVEEARNAPARRN